jgi:hypothetical protein
MVRLWSTGVLNLTAVDHGIQREAWSGATFSTTNSIRTNMGSNPCLRDKPRLPTTPVVLEKLRITLFYWADYLTPWSDYSSCLVLLKSLIWMSLQLASLTGFVWISQSLQAGADPVQVPCTREGRSLINRFQFITVSSSSFSTLYVQMRQFSSMSSARSEQLTEA